MWYEVKVYRQKMGGKFWTDSYLTFALSPEQAEDNVRNKVTSLDNTTLVVLEADLDTVFDVDQVH